MVLGFFVCLFLCCAIFSSLVTFLSHFPLSSFSFSILSNLHKVVLFEACSMLKKNNKKILQSSFLEVIFKFIPQIHTLFLRFTLFHNNNPSWSCFSFSFSSFLHLFTYFLACTFSFPI